MNKGRDITQAHSATEPVYVEAVWQAEFLHVKELHLARHLDALSEGALIAICCAACGSVSLPARSRCPACRSADVTLQEVGPEATIRATAMIDTRMAGVSDLPAAIACVQPDGADTGLLARLHGLSPEQMAAPAALVGQRCRSVAAKDDAPGTPNFEMLQEG